MQRGLDVQFTENRIGAGVSLSDHSFAKPRVYMITGAVSGIAHRRRVVWPADRQAGALLDDVDLYGCGPTPTAAIECLERDRQRKMERL